MVKWSTTAAALLLAVSGCVGTGFGSAYCCVTPADLADLFHDPDIRDLGPQPTSYKQLIQAYKIPRLVKFVSEAELPLTVTGKLQKNRLVEFFTRGT